MKTREEIERDLENIQFLSPNEPITEEGILRVLMQMDQATIDLEKHIGNRGKTITLWNPSLAYDEGDIVLYFKKEQKQHSVEDGKREFAFILVSLKPANDSIPSYDIVDGIPNFVKSGWNLLNPLSYLLQDIVGLKAMVKEVFVNLLEQHVVQEHGIKGANDISSAILRKDYSNLKTPWEVGKYSLTNKVQDISGIGFDGTARFSSNGILEYGIRYSYEEGANPYLQIKDRRYYYEKSPIWDESDHSIFSRKYMEDDLFSVNVNMQEIRDEQGVSKIQFVSFSNLRFGTNVFHRRIDFPTPFVDDEYTVFFDTYGAGDFVFGYDKEDLESQEEPTYDPIVSMPMLLNKSSSGFDIVLPIHCHFNSIQKYNIGVPWDNKFRLQAIGRYR